MTPHFFSSIVLWLALLHGASATADGFSTTYWERACRTCYEIDPIDRAFIGRRPSWERMGPWGAAEVAGAALLAQEMRRHPRTRKWFWVPQIVLSTVHVEATIHNYVRRYPR